MRYDVRKVIRMLYRPLRQGLPIKLTSRELGRGALTRDKVSIRVSSASATALVFLVFGKPPDLCQAIACLESSVERHGSPNLRPVVVFNADKPFPARTPLDTKPDRVWKVARSPAKNEGTLTLAAIKIGAFGT
jgi:hypothetical protein